MTAHTHVLAQLKARFTIHNTIHVDKQSTSRLSLGATAKSSTQSEAKGDRWEAQPGEYSGPGDVR